MGVNLKDLVATKTIDFEFLAGKKIAIDAYNALYQFLSAIRQRDGRPLMDSRGNITSHLTGLFSRTANMMEKGILPIYVFDGDRPELKQATLEKRAEIKKMATKKMEAALKKGDHALAKKYAQQTSRLTSEMVKESKELIAAMGLPVVQALADGEAQAAYMAQKGFVYAVGSQDWDSLLFGAPIMLKNLTISKKRKLPGQDKYVPIALELIDLSETINRLQIDREGLVKIALLIGTDFNAGIKGLGPKKAYKVVKEGRFDEYKDQIPNYQQVIDIFMKPAITTSFSMTFGKPNEKKIKEILVERHEFTEARVNSTLKKIIKSKNYQGQSALDKFI